MPYVLGVFFLVFCCSLDLALLDEFRDEDFLNLPQAIWLMQSLNWLQD